MNFKQMQVRLEGWITEHRLREGTWTTEQKKAQLNEACLSFVADTKFLLEDTIIKTIDGQVSYDLPEDFLTAESLYVNDKQYRLVTRREHVKLSRGNLNIDSGESAFFEYYYVDRVKKKFFIKPASTTDDQDIAMTYVPKPNELIEPRDVSIIEDIFHSAIPAYAAYEMLPKEMEGDGRGLTALRHYNRKVIQAMEFNNHRVDDNSEVAPLGPEFRNYGDVLSPANNNFDLFDG